jgi:L-ascorbate metabolism protein UlaG (beta-lactamase superfamily)
MSMRQPIVKYLGHASFKLTTENDKTILIDPFLKGNPQCALSLKEFTDTDLILVTHGAFDHMGEAVEIAKLSGAVIVCGPDVKVHAVSNGVPERQTRLLVWGGEIELYQTIIKSLKADHPSFFKSGDSYLSCGAMSFLITTPSGLRIYAMGDSSIFMDLQLFGQLYRPHVALLPVGGFPGYFTEMSPREAAMAAMWLGVRLAIPMHYTSDPENGRLFKEICQGTCPAIRVLLMKPGEEVVIDSQEVH